MVAPFKERDWEKIASTLSMCNWTVALEDGAPVARANQRMVRSVTLPFEPSLKPKWQFARCRCDPEAEANDPLQRVTDYVTTPIGFLVAYDAGEFGGGLRWFDASGTFRQVIAKENTMRLFETPKGILALMAYSHGGAWEGRLMRLKPVGHRWRIDTRSLPGESMAVSTETNGAFLIATERVEFGTQAHVVRVDPDFRVKTLHKLVTPFPNFNANSVIRSEDGTIYLGGSYAVIRLRPKQTGYEEDWLAPPGAEWDPADSLAPKS